MEDSPLGLDKWLIVTYAKGKSDVKRKEDLSKNNGKKVYYPRLLSVPAK